MALRLVIILCWFAWAVYRALTQSIDVPTFHLDGAFQTASALYRLHAGQFPGRDFLPYLGIGPTFTLYPLFRMDGADMAAAVFAAHLMVAVAAVAATSLLWHLVWRPARIATSVAAGACVVATYLAVSPYLPSVLVVDVVTPGHSLRPVRSVLPYLVGWVWLIVLRYVPLASRRLAMAALISAGSLLWSNDYAVPTVVLFACFAGMEAWRRGEFTIGRATRYALLAGAAWMMLLTMATLGHPVRFLQYNLLDVAGDQWFYFGGYRAVDRVFDVVQLCQVMLDQGCTVALLVLAATTGAVLVTRRIEHALLAWIGFVLLAGAILATVGGHVSAYFEPFRYWGVATAGIGAVRLCWLAIEWAVPDARITVQGARLVTLGACVLWVASLAGAAAERRMLRAEAASDARRFFVPELGGYLRTEFRDYITLARTTPRGREAEEYWGLWSATRRTFPPWPVDAVMHALGRTRQDVMQQLGQVDRIITTRRAFASGYQPWSLSQNYWFYAPLMSQWEQAFVAPTTVVWTRLPDARTASTVGCRVRTIGYPLVFMEASAPGMYEVSLRYRYTGSRRVLLMARNNVALRYYAGEGYVSLDPRAETGVFPVRVRAAGTTAVGVRVVGGREKDLMILSCDARRLPARDVVELH